MSATVSDKRFRAAKAMRKLKADILRLQRRAYDLRFDRGLRPAEALALAGAESDLRLTASRLKTPARLKQCTHQYPDGTSATVQTGEGFIYCPVRCELCGWESYE